MSSYQPEVMRNYADQLLSRASSMRGVTWLTGFFLGASIGYLICETLNVRPWEASLALALLCSTVADWQGRAQATSFRVEAQRALCMLQIEENTRRLIAMMNEREDLQLMVKLEAAAVQSRNGHAARTNIITAVSSEP